MAQDVSRESPCSSSFFVIFLNIILKILIWTWWFHDHFSENVSCDTNSDEEKDGGADCTKNDWSCNPSIIPALLIEVSCSWDFRYSALWLRKITLNIVPEEKFGWVVDIVNKSLFHPTSKVKTVVFSLAESIDIGLKNSWINSSGGGHISEVSK